MPTVTVQVDGTSVSTEITVIEVEGFDAAAINAAIAHAESYSASSSGGNGSNGVPAISFRPGNYWANAPIVVTKSGHTWIGPGQRTCTIQSGAANRPIVQTGPLSAGGGGNVFSFKIADMGFVNAGGYPGVTGIDLTGAQQWTLSRVNIGWCTKAGLYLGGGPALDGSQDCMFGEVDNCNFENMMSGALGAIYADPVKRGAGYMQFSGTNRINGDSSHASSTVGIAGLFGGTTIKGVNTESVYQPIDVSGQSIFIRNNVFECTNVSIGSLAVRIRANANAWAGGINYPTIAVVLAENSYEVAGVGSKFVLTVDPGCTDVYQQLDSNPAGNPYLLTRKLA